jgi:signal peptidase II
MTRFGRWAFAIAILIVVLDQAAKFWIVNEVGLQPGTSLPLIWPLSVTWVMNPGVSYGLLQTGTPLVRWGLTLFAFAVAAAIGWWARRSDRVLPAVGLGLIMGGALGNAVDRIRFGAVVDFLDVQRLGFFPWIFNVADSAITFGVIFILLDGLRRERPAQ